MFDFKKKLSRICQILADPNQDECNPECLELTDNKIYLLQEKAILTHLLLQ